MLFLNLHLKSEPVALVNDAKIKQTGAKGIVKLTDTSIQIIIGTEVSKVKKELDELL